MAAVVSRLRSRVRRIRMEEGSTYLPGTASAEVLLRQGRDHAEVVDTLMREIGMTHQAALLVCRRLAATQLDTEDPRSLRPVIGTDGTERRAACDPGTATTLCREHTRSSWAPAFARRAAIVPCYEFRRRELESKFSSLTYSAPPGGDATPDAAVYGHRLRYPRSRSRRSRSLRSSAQARSRRRTCATTPRPRSTSPPKAMLDVPRRGETAELRRQAQSHERPSEAPVHHDRID